MRRAVSSVPTQFILPRTMQDRAKVEATQEVISASRSSARDSVKAHTLQQVSCLQNTEWDCGLPQFRCVSWPVTGEVPSAVEAILQQTALRLEEPSTQREWAEFTGGNNLSDFLTRSCSAHTHTLSVCVCMQKPNTDGRPMS